MIRKLFINYCFIFASGIIPHLSFATKVNTVHLPSVHVRRIWIRETFPKAQFTKSILQPIYPVLTEELVIQGNKVSGLLAYTRDKGRKLWDFKIKGGLAGAVLVKDQQLFFGGADGFIYSISAGTGKQHWKQYVGATSMSRPVLKNNRLYFSDPSKLYCVNAKTGQVIWTYSASIKKSDFTVAGVSSPLVSRYLIYFKVSDGNLIAVNHKGRFKWQRRLSDPSDRFTSALSAPVMGKVCLYSAGFESGLYCLNKKTGKVIWRTFSGSHGDVLLSGTMLFYPTSDGHILALDQKSGKQIWIYKTPRSIATNFTLYKGILIYGEYSGALRFLSEKTGQSQGAFFFGKGLSARPVLSPVHSMLYFMSNYGWLYKIQLLVGKKV